MELGLFTFGDLAGNAKLSPAERTRSIIEEAVLAEEVGLDVFGVGEHHRSDYIVSSPAVLLAAIASRTERIKLTSAVTVLSSDDPVRVYQDFATIDHISNGRAELMAGRGSFIESFPLFGYDLDDYDELFTEKLDLLLALRKKEAVTWTKGRFRAPIRELGVYPRAVQDPLPVWVAVGGSPESVVRVAQLGLPMALAIIGGNPDRFVPFADLYRDMARKSGFAGERVKLSINSHAYLAEDSQQATAELFPVFMAMFEKVGQERGWPPVTRAQFDAARGPRGHLFAGSPQEVIDKILWEHELFKNERLLLQIALGDMPHAKVLKAIELFGTRVAPVIRKELPST